MKVSIPVMRNVGLSSEVSGHFGKASLHLVVRLETGEVLQAVPKPSGEHGVCAPVEELSAAGVEAVACHGLGRGAMQRLAAGGIEIFHTEARTVAEVLIALRAGRLKAHRPEQACAGHGH